MSIEIRNLSIKSSVVQRQAEDGRDDEQQEEPVPEIGDALRAECRRMIVELLDARRER